MGMARMTDPGLRRQWPGWLLAALILAVIVTGTVAVACNR
jgi:hypothetical protein